TPAEPAAVLTDLGVLLAHMGREEEAARHLLAALDHDPDSGDAYAGLGYVRDRQQRLEEAHQLFAQALERAPRDATSYLLLGRHLSTLASGGGLAGDGSDVVALAGQARTAFASAAETDPSYGEAWAMRGIAQLLPGGDPGDGIPHLERAVRLLPGRTDLMLQLVGLYARAGREDEALALAEGTLARLSDPETAAAAHEEIERWGLIRAADEALAAGDSERAVRLFDQAVSITSDPELRSRMEERLAELQTRLEPEPRPR
ncbi:MAG: tetratricopeptide repeat protein, partial [Thermoanaerobaculia bacterium]|nr:tetratricopeptide repeat protein [Thermoanaerobaculia bacterium]